MRETPGLIFHHPNLGFEKNSPTKPTNSSPKKGRKFQQENTSEPTIDFQGAVVSFQGSMVGNHEVVRGEKW